MSISSNNEVITGFVSQIHSANIAGYTPHKLMILQDFEIDCLSDSSEYGTLLSQKDSHIQQNILVPEKRMSPQQSMDPSVSNLDPWARRTASL